MHPSSLPLQIILPRHQPGFDSKSVDERFRDIRLQASPVRRARSPPKRQLPAVAGSEMTKYAWIPANLTAEQIRSYFNSLPEDKVPLLGSVGEEYRRKQLTHQLPPQDDQPGYCKKLKEDEVRELILFSEQRTTYHRGQAEVEKVPFNEKKTLCPECRVSFEHFDMSVVAERAEVGMRWHPGCFVCFVCGELLVDLVYFCQDGKMLCGRHHAELLKRRCSACDEIIFSDECTEAEGRFWHINHFCCYECDQVLGGARYIMREGGAFCIKCFEDLYPDYCDTCGRKIGVDEGQFNHEGHRWHVSGLCFRCEKCKASLLEKPFVHRRGTVFCTGPCSQNQESATNVPGSKHFSSACEAGPLPVSHNIRRSLNLENLSLNDCRNEVSKRIPTQEIDVLIEAKKLRPDTIDAATNDRFTHRANGCFLSKTVSGQTGPISDPSPKQASAPGQNTKITVEADPTSPASTVSSKTVKQIHPHGHSTYKSTDSSGYSSSTVDYVEQSQTGKDHARIRNTSPVYQYAPVVHLTSSGERELDLCHGEDCPEETTSEFSFYTGTSAKNLFLDKKQQEKALPKNNSSNNSIALKKSSSTPSCLPVPTPVPAPRSFYPGSVVPFAHRQVKPELTDPWLHRSQVQPETFSPMKILPKSITAKPIIQRSRSERIFNHSRSKSSPCYEFPTVDETKKQSKVLPVKKRGSTDSSKSSTDRKELKSILKKTKPSKANTKLGGRESIRSDDSVFLPDSKNLSSKDSRVNFKRNQRLYSSSRLPDETRPSFVTSESLHFQVKINRSQSEIELGHLHHHALWPGRKKQGSRSYGKTKRCNKKLKRTRSSDFVYKRPAAGSNPRQKNHVSDDEDDDGWCSTCTSSSDDSDFERWDMLETSGHRKKLRRGSVPVRNAPIAHRRPSQPSFSSELSPDFYAASRDNLKSLNRRRSHDKKQCSIQ